MSKVYLPVSCLFKLCVTQWSGTRQPWLSQHKVL